MDNNTISEKLFRSPRIPICAALYTGAASVGFAGVLQLLDPGARKAMLEDLLRGDVTSVSALQTWQFINMGILLAGFLCAAVMAVCLWLEVLSRAGRGLNLLYTAAHWGLYAVNGSGIVALVILIWRALRYILNCLSVNEGAYYLYSMLVSETMMVAQAVFLFVLIRRFLNSLCDSAASMAYMRASGKMDSVAIPGLAPTGFLILGLANVCLGVERLFTLIVVRDYLNPHYAILVAEHPVLHLSAGMCLLCAGANLLFSFWLRKYKRSIEYQLFLSRKQQLVNQ